MTNMNLKREELKELFQEVLSEVSNNGIKEKEWWTLADACSRKGLNYKTACNRTNLQPNHGLAEAKIGGRKTWHWTTIENWLKQTDLDIEQGVK